MLAIGGRLVPVPGHVVVSPAASGGPEWASLAVGDHRARKTTWIRQVMLHTVRGAWPQPIRPGAGPGGEAERYADIWRSDPAHSGAHIVIESSGRIVCFGDLAYMCAYHAEMSNDWSIGLEMMQFTDGGIYEATLTATAALVRVLCHELGIPEMMPRGPYRNAPLRRMETGSGSTRHQLGGPDVVGVLGHRDNTSNRGRGDPGDAIWQRLAGLGFEGIDYDDGEDIELGIRRQLALNAADARKGLTWAPLVVDGVCGPASIRSMRRHGFERWRDVG